MPSTTKPLRYLILSLIFVAIAGCRSQQGTLPAELANLPASSELAEILGLKIERPLEVSLVSPKGEAQAPSDYEAVTVVFNQPMKTLSADAAEISEPFKIEPATPGRFRWKGTATVSFTPTHPFLFGTKYTITIPSGLKSLSGKALAESISESFVTPGPKIARIHPDNDSKLADGDILALAFDQPVSAKNVEKVLISLTKSKISLRARSLTEEEAARLNSIKPEQGFQIDRTIAIEPDPSWSKGVLYSLRLNKGLVGEVGPEPTTFYQDFSFTTLPTLSLKIASSGSPAYPENGLDLEFSTEVSLKELRSHLKISPNVDIASNEGDDGSTLSFHTIYGNFQPNTAYTLTFDKDLSDIYGQKLGKDVALTWKTSDRQPLVQVAEGIGVLEATGRLSIPMGVQNILSQTVRLKLLTTEDAMRLAALDTDKWLYTEKPYIPPEGFDLTQKTGPLRTKNQIIDRPIDLSPVMKGKKFGFVYYQVDSEAESGKDKQTWTHRGLAQITNLTATGKFSPENSLFLATSLDKAKPLSGIEAIVADGLGRPIWRGKTGADGRLTAPGWSELIGEPAETYSEVPLTLFLKQGEDQVFIRNGAFGTVWPWRFGIDTRYSSSSHQLATQTYCERGLYLPGEQVQLKGAIRDRSQDKWSIPKLPFIDYELFNSRDESVEKGSVAVSSYGTFHHSIKLAKNYPTGSYRLDYRLPEQTAKAWKVAPELSGTSFRVEEFEPADFEVKVTSEATAATMGEDLDFKVASSWLFGSPMQESKLKWYSYLEPASYSSPDYPGYSFGCLDYVDSEDTVGDQHQELTSGEDKTDKQGLFRSKLSLKGIPYRGDGNLIIEATVTSNNRRSVTGRLALPLARGQFRIGAKLKSFFAESRTPTSLQLITLSPDGKAVAGHSFTLELIRRQWNSVRKSEADGSFHWTSEVTDSVISTQHLKSGEQPLAASVTPKEAGFYLVRLSAKDQLDNTITSETSFYAMGSEFSAWQRADDNSMELVADKAIYKPGETAQVLIKSPYQEATALITYERDTILHSYTTTLKGSAPVIDIPLNEQHVPNIYVSVMLMRGRVAAEANRPDEDTGKPAFKIGYINLPVQSDSMRLNVEIETDKESYGPGDEVTVNLKVSDQKNSPVAAELSLTAADLGALSLVNYKTPDFFDTFYGTQPLAVRTAESLLDVIGQRSYGTKGEDSGGGGGYDSSFRSDFRLTALWEPKVQTDAKGLATIKFKLPDNLTTFRLMATAITKDTRCGKSEKNIVIGKPLILKASAPSFALAGDEFEAGVLAVNGSQEDHMLKVSLEAEGITVDAAPKEVFLKKGEERELRFKFKAVTPGTAVLKFKGELGKFADGLEFELPIKPVYQAIAQAVSGKVSGEKVVEALNVPSSALEDSATVSLTLAPTVVSELKPSLDFLENYPYDCLEQRLSKLNPQLLSLASSINLSSQSWDKNRLKNSIDAELSSLSDHQTKDGGLAIWADSEISDPYLTALALRAADEAKKAGLKDYNWTVSARSYLKQFLDGSKGQSYFSSPEESLSAKAAALEALTRYSFQQSTSYLNLLVERRSKMTLVGKAYLLEAAYRLKAKDTAATLASELTNALKIENATAYFDDQLAPSPWLYSSQAHDTSKVLQALLDTEQKLPPADKVVAWLLEARNADGTWGTTATNSSALSALWSYSRAFEEHKKNPTSVAITVGSNKVQTVDFDGKKLSPLTQTTTLGSGSTKIELAPKDKDTIYYSLLLNYRDKTPQPAVDQGLTVIRTITDLDNNPVQELKAGEIYKVQLSVIAPSLRRFVILENSVPAGLSVVKTDFATESHKLAALLQNNSDAHHETFTRFETYSDRVSLFANVLAPGEYNFSYLVKAQTPGSYRYLAAQASEMYHPELMGRTSVSAIVIK